MIRLKQPRKNLTVTVLILLLVVLYISCDKNSSFRSSDNALRDSMLNQAERAVSQSAPNAFSLIQKGMKQCKDSFYYYRYCILLGNVYRLNAKPDSMIIFSKKALKYAERQKKTPEINAMLGAAYEEHAIYYYFFRMKSDSCIYYHRKAYQYMMESGNMDKTPDICANMADAYVQNNDIVKAAYWYRRALFLTDSLNLPHSENLSLYLGLAQVYLNLKDYETSLHYYQLTERFYRELSPNMQSYFLNNFGNFYYYTNNYPKAMQQFRKLMKVLLNGYKNESDINLCRINMADVFLKEGQLDSAQHYVDLCSPYFIKMKLDAAIYYANTIKIALALKRGQPKKAREIINSETVAPPNEPNITEIRHKYLREYYTRTGNYKSAYYSLVASNLQNDSLEHNKSHMRAAEIMMRFQQDTISLHKQININMRQKEVRTAYLMLTLLIAFMVIIVLSFILYINYSRKRHLQTQIDLLRVRLLNVRNRISPHFIFNVLNHEINNRPENSSEELTALAKLIRGNLDLSRHAYITIDDEIKFVQNYIAAERYILGDDFQLIMNIPGEEILKNITLPSMFIQILVENAIKHGLLQKKGHRELRINIEHNDKNTDIYVQDNGSGFSIKNSLNTGSQTGLYIIRQTIYLINQRNKNKMSFQIHNMKSESGEILGCEASLHIPTAIKFLD